MTGFSTSWLDLREPVDHAARDRRLLDLAAARLNAGDDPLVVDLGCGTGSTMRALAPRLQKPVRWRLLDNDPALLREAASRAGGKAVDCVAIDLREVQDLHLEDADLVTASALFDLVSREWLERLAAKTVARGIAVYAALNVDGRIEFDEPHPLDAVVIEAFAFHQLGEKGFGSAVGPAAPDICHEVFTAAGGAVEMADSPWRIEADELGRQFVDGVAQAAVETARIEPAELSRWRDVRMASPAGRVGHTDVFVVPRTR